MAITYNKHTIIRGLRWEFARVSLLASQGEVKALAKARASYTAGDRSQDVENSSARKNQWYWLIMW